MGFPGWGGPGDRRAAEARQRSLMSPLLLMLLPLAALGPRALAVIDPPAEDLGVEELASQIGASGLDKDEVPAGRTLFLLHLLKQKLKLLHKQPTTILLPGCVCVPFYLCDATNTIITNGATVIDLRYRRCTGDLEVCCYPRRQTNTTTTTTTAATTTTTTVRTTLPIVTIPTTTTTTTTTARPTLPIITIPTTPAPMTFPIIFPFVTLPTTPAPQTFPFIIPQTLSPVTLPVTAATVPVMATRAPMTASSNQLCICVPITQCVANSAGTNTISGAGLIDPRQQLASTCVGFFVCCNNAATSATSVATSNFPVFTLPNVATMSTTARPTLPPIVPGQSCFCTLLTACSGGSVPMSMATSIDPRLILGRQGQPAGTCNVPNAVCCRIAQDTSIATNLIPSGEVKNAGTADACTCVAPQQCADGQAVTNDGIGAIDPRFGPCASATLVCCRIQNRQMTGAALTLANQPSQSLDICGVRDDTYAALYPAKPGTAFFAEFPWMVLLLSRQEGASDVFQCGGSLITSRAVLTAAHCIAGVDSGTLWARLGEWNTQSTSEPFGYQESPVQAVITHPHFYSGALYHDIAIVVLATPAVFAINVRPVCLPAQGQIFAPGTLCYASGWGRSSFGSNGQYQSLLRKVDLPIIDNESCQASLRTTRLGHLFQLHSSFICAGGQASKDTCYKDGGGPLVCQDRATSRFYQAGIISWGIGCGGSTPAVYASVAKDRTWIDQQLIQYGIYV